MSALFATTLLLSAGLLFLVQPIVAKMVLPLLGGAPSVWNTAMVFFQAMLLGGYSYAHWIGKSWSLRRQVFGHVALLLTGALFLPIGLSPWTMRILPEEVNPAFWLLLVLLVSVGLPFFAVSANGPLLQHWFSRLPGPSARDPYFLYAASNLGSLAALLSYPVLVEPHWRLGQQSWIWAGGFVALIGMVLICGLVALWLAGHGHGPDRPRAASAESNLPQLATGERIDRKQRATWVLLALAPASLMLGVTTYLTTDIASIPLLWLVPLSGYLLTFVVAFSRLSRWATAWSGRVLPIATLGLFYVLLSEGTQPVWLIMPFHLLTFFCAAMACHGRLAAERPAPEHLTEFYFWVSFGGMIGGLFSALAAPVLFTRITEYPVALVLACALLRGQPSLRGSAEPVWKKFLIPTGVGALTLALVLLEPHGRAVPHYVRLGLMLGAPLLACFFSVDRPSRFALSLVAVLLGTSIYAGAHGKPLHAERNFFGVLRVTCDPIGPYRRLVHGNTLHGRQSLDPEQSCEPLSYYHRGGPVGQIMAAFQNRNHGKQVGVVGLGAGSMAAYAAPDEQWTFYEINPAVARIARNRAYFTFLEGCAQGRARIVLGDARLRLRDAAPGQYGLLVLDAFSSDAIPLHLITREALQLYLSKLAPDGLLAFHISNRYLDLESVLGDLAADAGLLCHAQDELEPNSTERAAGKDPSHWVVMARHKADLGRLGRDSRWLRIQPRTRPEVWTDDFSNVLSVFRWD